MQTNEILVTNPWILSMRCIPPRFNKSVLYEISIWYSLKLKRMSWFSCHQEVSNNQINTLAEHSNAISQTSRPKAQTNSSKRINSLLQISDSFPKLTALRHTFNPQNARKEICIRKKYKIKSQCQRSSHQQNGFSEHSSETLSGIRSNLTASFLSYTGTGGRLVGLQTGGWYESSVVKMTALWTTVVGR